MNITLLSAELARLVPLMAKDSAVNNETLLTNKLNDFRNSVIAECAGFVRSDRSIRHEKCADNMLSLQK